MPRVPVPSIVYVNKCQCKGTLKYIGIPSVDKNKSRSIYYGIELEEAKGKNNGTINKSRYFRCTPHHGIFVKKDGFEYVPTEQAVVTPGGPDNDHNPKRRSRKFVFRGRGSQKSLNIPLTMTRSKSNGTTTSSSKKMRQKSQPQSSFKRAQSRPTTPDPSASSHTKRSKSQQIRRNRNKGSKTKFKRNTAGGDNKKRNRVTVSKAIKPTDDKTSSTKGHTKRGRSQTKRDFKHTPALKRPKSAKPTTRTHGTQKKKSNITTPKASRTTQAFLSPKCATSDDGSTSTSNDESSESDDVLLIMQAISGAKEEETERRNSLNEEEAKQAITETLSIRNYRLFIPRIEAVKKSMSALEKKAKKRIINETQLQEHDNDLMIWQNILHLALFIVKAMHSFFTLEEKKQTWDFVDFLLQNGGDPLTKMTIKQDDIYEHKNVFRLMTEALKTYKQNELLIVKRFRWLWSLVLRQDEPYAVNRPSIVTFDTTFTNHWIVADAYDELPSPRILREYFNFGSDLVHLCGEEESYYDFNEIRNGVTPDAVISTVRITRDMAFCLDMVGRIVLYYKHYVSLRMNDLMSVYQGLVEKRGFADGVSADMMHTIVSYTVTEVVYLDNTLQEVNVIAQTVRRMPNYSRDWKEFLFKHILYKVTDKKKAALKALTKSWDAESEWDYFIANLKKKQQFMCCIDVFEHVIGYKTAQKITDYYIKKNNLPVVQQYMQNENAFKFLELYNLLFNYSLKRSECAKFIFQRLVDLVLNRRKSSRGGRKQSRSMARKELTNLYVQFCRHEVSDWMFQQNLLFILRQLLPASDDVRDDDGGGSRKGKKAKKAYRFDFGQAILHCYKAGQLNTLVFLIDNKMLLDVERALRLFYVDDVVKRIIFGMEEFDEQQEDFLKLILNWTWTYAKSKEDMKTWYVKWLDDAQSVQDPDCCKIFEYYCNLYEDA
eukprot:122235_1